MSESQGEALFLAAKNVPTGTAIVEIGSHQGRSTIVLGKAKPRGTRLVAVDPWGDPRWGGGGDSLPAFTENLRRAEIEGVEVRRGVSETVVKEWDRQPIGLLYIDGAHDLKSVLIDIDGWEPFIAEGGIVCIHDAFSSVGVTRAILKRHFFNRRFRYIGSRRTLAMFRREQLSPLAAVWSATRQICRLGYFIRNLAVKVALRRHWRGVVSMLGHREGGAPY